MFAIQQFLLLLTLSFFMKPSCQALRFLCAICQKRHGGGLVSISRRGTTARCPPSSIVRFSSSFSTNGSIDDIIKTLSPGESYTAEMEVKKSRFLGYASNAGTWDEAKSYIEQVKSEHPKARHWCYGYCGGHHPVNERSSDDGEPSGTAGAPILQALRGADLSDAVCVVVRYFGGVKLGAGGLIRAYGAAARQVLREAPVQVRTPTTTVQVTVATAYIGTVYELVARMKGNASNERYGADGSLTLTIQCDLSDRDRLRQSLQDATKGSAVLT